MHAYFRYVACCRKSAGNSFFAGGLRPWAASLYLFKINDDFRLGAYPWVYVLGSGLEEDGGKNFSTVARVGAGVSRLTSAIQKAEPRHMNITGI